MVKKKKGFMYVCVFLMLMFLSLLVTYLIICAQNQVQACKNPITLENFALNVQIVINTLICVSVI